MNSNFQAFLVITALGALEGFKTLRLSFSHNNATAAPAVAVFTTNQKLTQQLMLFSTTRF